jgi:hypothetical protein
MIERFWTYQKVWLPETVVYFDRSAPTYNRPPVFIREKAEQNVIFNPDASQTEVNKLVSLLPEHDRHKWFRSMNSSQALAQSLFGNLAVHHHLNCVSDLKDDVGFPLFEKAMISSENFVMESKVSDLGEPRSSSLDVFFSGNYRVTIECKLTEIGIGVCSRPFLKPSDSNYDTDLCDGNYRVQRTRKERCPLTEKGILYWKLIPALFDWRNDKDADPCPLNRTYQLVRNILAACTVAGERINPDSGHSILIYDERNPAFQSGGAGLLAYEQTQKGLKESTLIRKCSWQRITNHIREQKILPWLTVQLMQKYGI